MRTGTFARAVAVSGAVLLAATACGGGSDSDDAAATGGGDGGSKQVNVYGTDGNMGNALGADFTEEGALAGMKGTTPLTELGDDFKNRCSRSTRTSRTTTTPVSPTTPSSSPPWRRRRPAATRPPSSGPTSTASPSVARSARTSVLPAIINAGGNVDYDGITGPLSFTDAGEPAEASFGLLQFGEDNQLDDSLTQFVLAGDEANATTDEGPAYAAPGTTGQTLTIGTLLPLTGNLAFLGPPEVAGVQLAINDINSAGGVFGTDVALVEGDSGDASTDTAHPDRGPPAAVQRQRDHRCGVLGREPHGHRRHHRRRCPGVLPANTSDQFTTYNDQGLYFRTAPPDTLQARALADLIGADGNNTVGILAINDPYGTGLAENTMNNLISDGLSEDSVQSITYDPQAANFDSEVQRMVDFNPDAIVVIGSRSPRGSSRLSTPRASARSAER